MYVPTAKTKTNNGYEVVTLYFSNDKIGYLIPLPTNEGSLAPDLQVRRDLLPVFMDDGYVGRNNVVNRNNGFLYKKPMYGSFKDAFCSLQPSNFSIVNNGNRTIISCEAGSYTDIRPEENGVRKSGILKIANPQKAH